MIKIPKNYYLKIENNEITADHGPALVRKLGSFGKWVFKVLKRFGLFSEYSLTKIRKIAESQLVTETKSLEAIKEKVTTIDPSSKRERKIQAIFSYIKQKENTPETAPSQTVDIAPSPINTKNIDINNEELEEIEEIDSQSTPVTLTHDLPLLFEPLEIFYLTGTPTAEGIKGILKKLPSHIRHLEIRTAGNVDDYVDLIPPFITSLTLHGISNFNSLEKLPRSLKMLEVNMEHEPFSWQEEDYQDLPELTALTIVSRLFFADTGITIPPGYFDYLPKTLKHFALAKSDAYPGPTCYLDHNIVFPEGLESLRLEGFVFRGLIPNSNAYDYTINIDMLPSTLKKLTLPVSGISKPELIVGTKGWPQGLTELFIIGQTFSLVSVIRDLPSTLTHLSILQKYDGLDEWTNNFDFPPHLKTLCLSITPRNSNDDSFVFKNLPDSLEVLTLSGGKTHELESMQKSKTGWFALLDRDKGDVFPRKEGAPPLRIQFMIKDDLFGTIKQSLNWNVLKKWGITPSSFIVDRTFDYNSTSALATKAYDIFISRNSIFYSRYRIPQTPIVELASEEEQEPVIPALDVKKREGEEEAALFSIPPAVMLEMNLLHRWDTVGLVRMMQSGIKAKYYQHYLAMQAELVGRADHGLSLQQMAESFIPVVNHFLLNNNPRHQNIIFNFPPYYLDSVYLDNNQINTLQSIVNAVLKEKEGIFLLKRFNSPCLLAILTKLEAQITDEVYNNILAELLTRENAVLPKKIIDDRFSAAVQYINDTSKTVYLRHRYNPDEIKKFLSALPPKISGLDIRVEGNVDDFIEYIPPSIISLTIRELEESNFNTEKLPRELQKLEICMISNDEQIGDFFWTEQKFKGLPPDLTSLHIESAAYENDHIPNYYIESLPATLKHLEIICLHRLDIFTTVSMDNNYIFPASLETLELKAIGVRDVNNDSIIKTTMFPATLKKLSLSLFPDTRFVDEENGWPKALVDLSLDYIKSQGFGPPSVTVDFLNSLPQTLTNLSILGTTLKISQTKDFIYPPHLKTLTIDATPEELEYDRTTRLPPNEHAKTFCLENLPVGLDTLTLGFARKNDPKYLQTLCHLQRGWFAFCKRSKNEVFIRDENAVPLRIQFMMDRILPKNMNWQLLKNWDISPNSFVTKN